MMNPNIQRQIGDLQALASLVQFLADKKNREGLLAEVAESVGQIDARIAIAEEKERAQQSLIDKAAQAVSAAQIMFDEAAAAKAAIEAEKASITEDRLVLSEQAKAVKDRTIALQAEHEQIVARNKAQAKQLADMKEKLTAESASLQNRLNLAIGTNEEQAAINKAANAELAEKLSKLKAITG